jgi:hypothetical protein
MSLFEKSAYSILQALAAGRERSTRTAQLSIQGTGAGLGVERIESIDSVEFLDSLD